MSAKLRVGILGATGTVGQRFVQLLEYHPQFEVTAIAASDRSEGGAFEKACTWSLPGNLPEFVTEITVQSPHSPLGSTGAVIPNTGLLVAQRHFDALWTRTLVV